MAKKTATAVDDRPSWVLVERLRALCDPIRNPPWEGVAELTIDGIREAAHDGFFQPISFSGQALPATWSTLDHIARIAYLVVHGWGDPVSVDVGVPELNCWMDWPVTDGNHRLAAAIVRGDEFILAELTGSCNHMAELFGEMTDA